MTSKDIKPVIEQPATEIPLMLAQVIIVAGVLAIGEIACSPLYFTLMDHSLALVPWALEAAFLAVAFTFVVGFALLWCAESFTFKLKERFRPFGYAAVGLIGYGVWSLLVFTATINSILAKVGESVLTNGQVGAIAERSSLGLRRFPFRKTARRQTRQSQNHCDNSAYRGNRHCHHRPTHHDSHVQRALRGVTAKTRKRERNIHVQHSGDVHHRRRPQLVAHRRADGCGQQIRCLP